MQLSMLHQFRKKKIEKILKSLFIILATIEMSMSQLTEMLNSRKMSSMEMLT